MENEETDVSVGIGERLRAFTTEHSASTGKMVDDYLTTHLPEMIEKFDLALKSDLKDVDSKFNGLEGRVDDLESWREKTTTRVGECKKRTDTLEKKHGVK